jgi:hypothetical protein
MPSTFSSGISIVGGRRTGEESQWERPRSDLAIIHPRGRGVCRRQFLDRPRRREASGSINSTDLITASAKVLLEAGSTELPDCRCTAEMHLMAIVPVPGGDTEIRVFRCLNCSHELRLTAWRNDVSVA